jgi:D-alanyl-lipoteichoic acid acyltransferase DltB (MBOAT superfamily)
MLFNSVLYLVFLPLVVVVYHRLTLRQQQVFILLASYGFYWVWSIKYSVLLLVTTVVDYGVALWLDRESDERKRRWILWISMTANLTLLAVFKYADFLSSSVAQLFGFRPWPALDLTLPLGISFYTFMSMAYVIDVYRREIPARKSLLQMALFVSYFPHLVAGPILRASSLLPQLEVRHTVEWANVRRGVALILWGMLLKVYLADSAARLVTEAYAAPGQASGSGLLLATYAFAVQIYCDFSGYSDIAIGSALLLGVRLPENFQRPYLALTMRDFWRRWHISLSTWLRDYLYVPLGGSRKGELRTYVNLFLTMLLGGLWHGAGWNWVIWGALHGTVLAVERALGIESLRSTNRGLQLLRWSITFHLVCLSWVFFRSPSFASAWEIVTRIATQAPGEWYGGFRPLVLLALVLLLDFSGLRNKWLSFAETRGTLVRWVAIPAVALLVITFQGASNPEFIYFQF